MDWRPQRTVSILSMNEEAEQTLRREAARAAWWVRWHAKERGISLDQLAVYSGLGRTSITEMKTRNPSLRTLACVATFLGVDVRDLLQDIPKDEGSPSAPTD